MEIGVVGAIRLMQRRHSQHRSRRAEGLSHSRPLAEVRGRFTAATKGFMERLLSAAMLRTPREMGSEKDAQNTRKTVSAVLMTFSADLKEVGAYPCFPSLIQQQEQPVITAPVYTIPNKENDDDDVIMMGSPDQLDAIKCGYENNTIEEGTVDYPISIEDDEEPEKPYMTEVDASIACHSMASGVENDGQSLLQAEEITSRGHPADTSSYRRPPRAHTSPAGTLGRTKVEKNNAARRNTDPNGQDPGGGRRRNKTLAGAEEEEQIFACPYFKYDRVKHLNCLHFQLKRVKDVKQHIFRKHQFHCPTCYAVFPDCVTCEKHMKAMTCLTIEGPPSDTVKQTISDKQRVQLKERTSGGKSEDLQWYRVWSILFNGEKPPISPYLSSEVEETILTAREIFRRNSSRVFDGLNATVRLNSGSSSGTIASSNVAQGILNENTPEQTSDFVLSVLDELAIVATPEIRSSSDPVLTETELDTQQVPGLGHDFFTEEPFEEDMMSLITPCGPTGVSRPEGMASYDGAIELNSGHDGVYWWPLLPPSYGVTDADQDLFTVKDEAGSLTGIESSLDTGFNRVSGFFSAEYVNHWDSEQGIQYNVNYGG